LAEEPWNGQLFHVEQFEKGRNGEGFRCFFYGFERDSDGSGYGGGSVFYGGIFTVRWLAGDILPSFGRHLPGAKTAQQIPAE